MAVELKLLEIRKKVPYVKKDHSSQLKYTYVSSANIMGIIRPLLDEYKLLVVPEIVQANVHAVETTNKNGEPRVKYLTQLVMKYTIIDTEDNTKLSIPWYAQGYEVDSEKGFGKALTYSEKYFWLKQMNVQTGDDDPDICKTSEEETGTRTILKELQKMCDDCKSYDEYQGSIVPYYKKSGPALTVDEREKAKDILTKTVDRLKGAVA